MKRKKIFIGVMIVIISTMMLTACNSDYKPKPTESNGLSSQSSVKSNTTSSISSSSKSPTTSSTTSSKPKPKMRPEVEAKLVELESCLKRVNDHYLKLEEQYGHISKFPKNDMQERLRLLDEYTKVLEEVQAIDKNEAEWDYYLEITRTRLL